MAGDADRTLELWRQLAIVQRQVVRDLDRNLRGTRDHPANWIDALIALAGAPQSRQQMMDLADQLGMTRTALSGLANQMAAAGLVRREQHPTDHRGVLIVLTPRGRRELRRALPRYRDAIQQTALGDLTAAQGRALQRLLRTLGR